MQVALDQIEQQTALRRQQEFTDDLLDSIEDVVYVLDTDGDLRQWNRALGSVTGYGSETIASMNAADFFAGEDTERAAEAIEEGFETGRTGSNWSSLPPTAKRFRTSSSPTFSRIQTVTP